MTNLPSGEIQQGRALLQNAKGVLIALRGDPTLDGVAAALSFYLALSSFGREVSVACPSAMTVEFSHLVGVDKITNSVASGGEKNLVISFPYQEGSIEKVSYNIEGETFNLVIEPREGYPLITPEVVRYSYSGGKTDLILTIDTPTLAELNSIYNNNQSLFAEKMVVNIDYHPHNSRYGRVNLVDPTVSSTSELAVSLLSPLGLTLNSDMATNLLAGITFGSQNFTTANITAATFEAAAICLKNGGRKGAAPTPLSFPKALKPTTSFPLPPKKMPPAKPVITEGPHPETPPDWLKPKIYKGSTLL